MSLHDGDQLLLSRDGQQARREVARFSACDAERLSEYEERIGAVALTLRELALTAPPDFSGGWRNALRLLKAGNQLRKLSRAQRIDLAELMTKSLGDYLDSWFESDPLKGILGLECAIGNFVDPYQSGTAYVLLHHAFGEVNGRIGAWGHAKGGMGAITQAMAAFAESRGADIEVSAPVREILVQAGRACGVVTGDGERITARRRRREPASAAAAHRVAGPGAAACRHPAAHRRLPQPLRHLSHERGARRIAPFCRLG